MHIELCNTLLRCYPKELEVHGKTANSPPFIAPVSSVTLFVK